MFIKVDSSHEILVEQRPKRFRKVPPCCAEREDEHDSRHGKADVEAYGLRDEFGNQTISWNETFQDRWSEIQRLREVAGCCCRVQHAAQLDEVHICKGVDNR